MLQYFLKRVLLFVPTLFVVSLIIFFLSKQSEADLIQNKIERTTKTDQTSLLQEWKRIRSERKELGFDQAHFYWSMYRKSSCDTLNRIVDTRIQQNLAALSYSIGNWEKVDEFWRETKLLLQNTSPPNQRKIIEVLRNDLESKFSTDGNTELEHWFSSLKELQSIRTPLNNYLIRISWNGFNNQYHQWISSLVTGDFGRSFLDGKSVNEKLSKAIRWTISLSIISIVFTFLIAIPLAFYTAFHPKSLIARFLDHLFFTFYAMPNFWVATLLIVFLASGDYLSWFPAYGLGYTDDSASWLETLFTRISHLFLPLVTLTYGSIAFIYQQLKSSIQQQLTQDYILTAKAKGLASNTIKWKQLFKNVSFPLITIFGNLLPALISGSFVVEYIFSIPGMGKLSIEAFMSRDFGIIYTILMLSSFLGMLGILIADLLYYKLDPRVQLHTSNTALS